MKNFKYLSTKTFGWDRGFSVAIRQWRAHDTHCSQIHGYSLGFKFIFGTNELDERNWVVDFGGLKSLKAMLEDNFDHTLVVAEDDPELPLFQDMHNKGIIKLRAFPKVGCEGLAELVYGVTEVWLHDAGFSPRTELVSVEVSEHAANSAIYVG